MRRIFRHGLVAAGLCGLATATALATMPSGASQVEAVPMLQAPVAQVSASASAVDGDRDVRPDRGEARPALDDDVVEARFIALAEQQQAIKSNAAKLKKAAKEKAERAAEVERIRLASEKAARLEAKIDYDPNSSSPREIGKKVLADKGYDDKDFACFDKIIKRESMWRINATNSSSGAYGIPQALPGSKMASAGSDWRTNPATQVKWAIGYMESRYGSICGAWSFKSAHGWY